MGNNLDYLSINSEDIEKLHRTIAVNVKKIRKEKNINQLELALTIGHKSMSTIGKIEANLENKHYNIEQLYKISKALDVPICSFFNGIYSL
jgi:transcriptional regulator with XRE-family HTH domain